MSLAISKEKKQELVERYKQLLGDNSGVVLTSFTGLSVKDMEVLRGQIREAGGEFYVIKNRLAKLAFEDAGTPLPDEVLEGTTAAGFSDDGLPAVAKAIMELGKTSSGVKIKGGVVDGALYGARQMEQLAELPPLPVLRSQLLGVLQAPAGKFAGVMASSVRQVVNVVKAYADTEAAGEAAA